MDGRCILSLCLTAVSPSLPRLSLCRKQIEDSRPRIDRSIVETAIIVRINGPGYVRLEFVDDTCKPGSSMNRIDGSVRWRIGPRDLCETRFLSVGIGTVSLFTWLLVRLDNKPRLLELIKPDEWHWALHDDGLIYPLRPDSSLEPRETPLPILP